MRQSREHSAHIRLRGDWSKLAGPALALFAALGWLHDKLTGTAALEAVLKAQQDSTVTDVRELRAKFDNCK